MCKIAILVYTLTFAAAGIGGAILDALAGHFLLSLGGVAATSILAALIIRRWLCKQTLPHPRAITWLASLGCAAFFGVSICADLYRSQEGPDAVALLLTGLIILPAILLALPPIDVRRAGSGRSPCD